MERMLVVARRMLCLITGPGLRLTSPASSILRVQLLLRNHSSKKKLTDK